MDLTSQKIEKADTTQEISLIIYFLTLYKFKLTEYY